MRLGRKFGISEFSHRTGDPTITSRKNARFLRNIIVSVITVIFVSVMFRLT